MYIFVDSTCQYSRILCKDDRGSAVRGRMDVITLAICAQVLYILIYFLIIDNTVVKLSKICLSRYGISCFESMNLVISYAEIRKFRK